MGCIQSKPVDAEGSVQKGGDALAPPKLELGPGCRKEVTHRDSPTSPLEDALDVCYKPETETARLQALLDCKCLDTPDERRFDSITALLKQMFQVPMALVSLIDEDRLVFKSVAGTDCRQGNRLHSFCDASLRAPNPVMMIVPDTLEDARFCNSQFVAGPPHVRMYAGAPLVSSDGHVMGSLGVMDVQPRTFPAGALNMICNFAELVVRELERDKAREQLQQSRVETTLSVRRHMVRALSCFQEAVLLCDTAAEGWPILYVNDNFCTTTGFSEPASLSSSFWDLFHPPMDDGGAGTKAAAISAARGRGPFVVTIEGGHCASITLEFKKASSDHLSSAVPTIGIPNFVEGLDLEPCDLQALDCYYFAVVSSFQLRGGAPSSGPTEPSAPSSGSAHLSDRRAAPQRSPLDSTPSSGGRGGSGGPGSHLSHLVLSDPRSLVSYSYTRASFGLVPPDTLHGLKLGLLLGKGGYGKVHRGTWKSASVAVKIMESWVDPDSPTPTQAMLEALLSKHLMHPNIVQTFDFAFQIVESEPGDELSSSASELGSQPSPLTGLSSPTDLTSPGDLPSPMHKKQQVWIVQQYCNHGTLGDAVDRGWLRVQRSPNGPPNLWAILPTAQEIAAAVQYLHSQGVIHGDLTPGNVLLAGTRHLRRRDPRSFQAKVGDFGLSRLADSGCQLTGGTLGTLSHMPLELIERELLTTAVDAYSFGVLLLEMLTGQRAWAGRSPIQILTARTKDHQRLQAPPDCPPGLKELLEACLSDDHEQRPSFESIAESLDRLLEAEEARADAEAEAGARAAPAGAGSL